MPSRLIRLTESSISGRLVAETSTVSRAAAQYSASARLSGPVPWRVLRRRCSPRCYATPRPGPRLRVVQVVQVFGQDYEPESGEPGGLEGELVHGQLSCGQFGAPAVSRRRDSGTPSSSAVPCPPGQTRITAECVRVSATARFAATTDALRPGEAPATSSSWWSSPSDAVVERASSLKSRPRPTGGAPAAACRDPSRSAASNRRAEVPEVPGVLDPRVPLVPGERDDQADEQPGHQSAGQDDLLLGAAGGARRRGLGDDRAAGGRGRLSGQRGGLVGQRPQLTGRRLELGLGTGPLRGVHREGPDLDTQPRGALLQAWSAGSGPSSAQRCPYPRPWRCGSSGTPRRTRWRRPRPAPGTWPCS